MARKDKGNMKQERDKKRNATWERRRTRDAILGGVLADKDKFKIKIR
jgi:hypothetical protein